MGLCITKTLGEFTLFFFKNGWMFSIVLLLNEVWIRIRLLLVSVRSIWLRICMWMTCMTSNCDGQQWLQTRKMVETQGLPGSMAVDFQIKLMGIEASSTEWDGAKEAGGHSTVFSVVPFRDPGWEKRAEKCCRQKFGIRKKLPLESSLLLMGF